MAAILALLGARADSITIDEPVQLLAGWEAWFAPTYRISPEHPPLARLWLSAPLHLIEHKAPETEGLDYRRGDFFPLARHWLSERTALEPLLFWSRSMAVLLFLGLLLTLYRISGVWWGSAGGALGLLLLALDPNFLAHGHLATTDVAFSLLALLALWTWSRYLERPQWSRLVLCTVSVAALALTKFSWPLLAPAALLMAYLAQRDRRRADAAIFRPRSAAAKLPLAFALLGAGVWLGIWLGYGFQVQAISGPARASENLASVSDFGRPRPIGMDATWETVLHDPVSAQPARGIGPSVLRWLRDWRLLPEAYTYGLAYVRKESLYRSSYLDGEYALSGFRSYFLHTFLLKTPLPTLLLFGSGALAWWLRRRSASSNSSLATLGPGLLLFVATYVSVAIFTSLNLGHRHLLPIYPALYLLAAANVFWLGRRGGRVWVALLVAWLAFGTLRSAPDWIGYGNELAGGQQGLYRHLADSNVDWGQDIKRLQAYANAHPDSRIVLGQYGDLPLPAEFRTALLISQTPGAELASLQAGTYALSANLMLGVYQPGLRASSWRQPALRESYAQVHRERRATPSTAQQFDLMARARLISRLAEREADERIGASLFLFHLSAAELDGLLAPE